jgi:hypothetical protein
MEGAAMARIRSIHPGIPRSPRMQELSYEAKLMRVLLPLLCDDAGRMRVDYKLMVDRLVPGDVGALYQIVGWCDELEATGFVERYRIDDVDYLRMVHWHEEQKIDRPTRSVLPPSPNELPEDSRIRESLRKSHYPGSRIEQNQRDAGDSSAIRESADFFSGDDQAKFDRTALLNSFDRLGHKAEAAGSYIAALRATEMKAKYAGIAPAGADVAAPATPEAREAARLPSPEEANGVVPGAGVS